MLAGNVLPRVRDDLRIMPFAGDLFHVYDPRSHRHFKLGAQEVRWLRLLDGAHTLDEIRAEIPLQYFTPFFTQAARMGLLVGSESVARFDPFKVKRELFVPNTALAPRPASAIAFRRLLFWSAPFSTLVTIGILATFSQFFMQLIGRHVFSWIDVVFYVIAVLGVAVVHESAHAVVARSFGVNVPSIGVMLLYFQPAFYADVSGLAFLPDRGDRVRIMIAGILSNNAFAAIALVIAVLVPSFAVASYLTLFALINITIVVANVVPFLAFDGQFAFLELMHEPAFVANAWKAWRSKTWAARTDYMVFIAVSQVLLVAVLWSSVFAIRGAFVALFPAIPVDLADAGALIAALAIALAAPVWSYRIATRG